MQAPATRKQLTHDRIVDTAARLLRESGFEGVGVAGVMKRAGLTHGGFYAHFSSRQALLAEAVERAGEDSRARLQQAVGTRAAPSDNPFRALVESYLSELHLRHPDRGCPVAALGSEMPRQSGEVRASCAERVRVLAGMVRSALPAGTPDTTAGVVAAQLVGALQIARTFGDNAEGRRQLAASRQHLLDRFDSSRRA